MVFIFHLLIDLLNINRFDCKLYGNASDYKTKLNKTKLAQMSHKYDKIITFKHLEYYNNHM